MTAGARSERIGTVAVYQTSEQGNAASSVDDGFLNAYSAKYERSHTTEQNVDR